MDVDAYANSLTPTRRILIMVMVVLGSTLYSTTLLIASTLLPQMQGAMSATQDEISWAMTFNILATAVATPTTGWLTGRFGRRAVTTWCILGFSMATLMCGAADSLWSLIFWRVVQGGIGAPVIPLAQTILLDSFPRRQQRAVISIFGMAVVIGPVIGPTVGGFLAEAYSWRYAFYMIVPVGLVSFVGLRLALPRDTASGKVGLDWTGFLTLAVAIAAAQLALSRGQRLDWFESGEIVVETATAAIAFYMFLAHSLTARNPFLNLGLLKDRNYAIGLVLVAIYGMLNFTPMILLPPLLQQYAGYPDTVVGMIIGSRGIGATIGFFLAMFIGRLDPRVGMIIGFSLQVISGLWLMSLNLDVGIGVLAINGVLQGMAVGIIWVPLTAATFATVEPRYLAETTAVYHLLRNIGSSFFISLCVTEVVRTTSANYARMTEFISPFNESLARPWVLGAWNVDTVPGLARLAREIVRQAAMLGYINAFGMYTAASAVAVPLILLVGRRRKPATA